MRLRIPSIQLDAPVEKVGITQQGDLGTPQQNEWDGVGWYSAGTQPGQEGSVVMDGHLDRVGGAPAVFWNLKLLHSGDKVTVIDNKGQTYTYHVTRVASYPLDQAPLQEIFSVSGGKFLNLITCSGTWSSNQGQYNQRLVVYTSLD